MNVKNFIIGTVAAAIVYFFLGWLFYGILFKDIWPVAEGATFNIGYNTLGCLFSGAALAYVFGKFGNMSLQSAATTAGIMGLLGAISMRLFMMASGNCTNMATMITDAGVSLVMGAVAGAAINFLVGKFGGSNE